MIHKKLPLINIYFWPLLSDIQSASNLLSETTLLLRCDHASSLPQIWMEEDAQVLTNKRTIYILREAVKKLLVKIISFWSERIPTKMSCVLVALHCISKLNLYAQLSDVSKALLSQRFFVVLDIVFSVVWTKVRTRYASFSLLPLLPSTLLPDALSSWGCWIYSTSLCTHQKCYRLTLD